MKTLKKTICILLVLFMLAGAMPFAVFADDGGQSGDLPVVEPGGGDQPVVEPGGGDQPVVGPGGGGDQPYEPVDPDEESVVTFRGQDFALLNNDFYNVLYRKGTEYLILTRPYQDLSYTIGFDRDGTHIEVSEKRLSSPGHPVLLCPVPKEDGTSRPTEALKYRVIEAGDDDGWTDQSKYLEGIYDLGVEATDDFEECPEFCFDWKNNLIAFYCVETGDHLCQNSGCFYFGGGDPKPEESDFLVYQRVCPHEHTVTCPYTAPTCAQPGNKAYKYCEDCGSVLSMVGKRTYTDSAGVKHYYDENYFKIDTTDHDFRNGVCIYCGARDDGAPVSFTYNGDTFELINGDFYNKYYFAATEYIPAVSIEGNICVFTEDFETAPVNITDGSIDSTGWVNVITPVTDESIGMRRITNSLYYEMEGGYLDVGEDGAFCLSEEPGARFWFDCDNGKVTLGAYIESADGSRSLKLRYRGSGIGFMSSGEEKEVLLYQKVCSHDGAAHHEGTEAGCTAPGNLEYSYCPTCESYIDASGNTVYTNGEGFVVRYMSDEDFAARPTGHRYEGGVCVNCGRKAREYTLVTSDDMIVPSAKYRYIIVSDQGDVLAADLTSEYDNEAMRSSSLVKVGDKYYIDNTNDPSGVAALEFCLGTFAPDFPDMAMPEDGTPLYTLTSEVGYTPLATGEFGIYYLPANGGSFKYPVSLTSDVVRGWNYGEWASPLCYDPASQYGFALGAQPSPNVRIYRGEFEEDTRPAGEGEFTVTIEGGEGAFVYRNERFDGAADYDDVIEVTAYEVPGRTFKYWKTSNGDTIPDVSFRMLVRDSEYIFAVFDDISVFGAWELFKASGDCTVPDIYRRTNANGDTEYKKVYATGGEHSFDLFVPYDNEYHKAVCSACGKTELVEHLHSSAQMISEPTHTTPGVVEWHCDDCGDTFTVEVIAGEDHFFTDDWTVTEPAAGGFGKRSHKCAYCDETEECWYIDCDLESLLKDHYIAFTFSTRYGGSREERYYSYTRDDGALVYIFAMQLTTTNARDNDQTFIWMYIDDGDDTTKEPVYLTKSSADQSYIMGQFIWAPYDQVRNFDGFIEAIRYPDRVNVPGITQGNNMGGRGATLPWRVTEYAKAVNERCVTTDVDPSVIPALLGLETEAEDTSFAKTYVYENDELVCSGGGFDGCMNYRIDAYGGGDYDHYIVSPGGYTVYRFERASYTTSYFKEYREVIGADEYASLGENEKKTVVCVDGIADMISSFARGRIGIANFTLDVPNPYKAVRVQIDREVINSDYTVSGKDWETSCYLRNVSGVIRTEIPENYPNEYTLKFEWNEDNENAHIFDEWQIWNFGTEEWDTLSLEPTVIVNTYEEPFSGLTVIRPLYHQSEEIYHIEVVGGSFRYMYDPDTYTDAYVPAGSAISLEADEIEGKTFDHFEDSDGNSVDGWNIRPKKDEVYTAVFVDTEYWLSVEAYEYHGKVWIDGDYENAEYYTSVSGTAGTVVTFGTEGNTAEGYDIFLGWYAIDWDENGREVKNFISYSMNLTVEISQYNYIVAVWSNGETEPERIVKVRSANGFVAEKHNFDDFEEARNSVNSYSVIGVFEGNGSVSFYADPHGNEITKWTVSYLNGEGEEMTVEVECDEESFWLDDYDSYGEDKTVTVTGEEISHVHKFGSYRVTVQPTKSSSGVRTEYCADCGEIMATREILYLIGDVNGDGLITIRDLASLKKYIAGDVDDYYAIVNCDVNGDGSTTIKDIGEIKKILAS